MLGVCIVCLYMYFFISIDLCSETALTILDTVMHYTAK